MSELKPSDIVDRLRRPNRVSDWAAMLEAANLIETLRAEAAAWNRRASPTTEGREGGEALPSFAQIYSELEKARENLNRRYLNNNDQSAGRSSRAVFSAMCLLDTARALSPLVKDTTK